MQSVVIETGSEADAECVAEALGAFGCDVAEASGTWKVTVSRPDLPLAPVLSALEQCLGDNGIASVKVSLDGRTYVMEAVA
jgi:hypothetical protein